MTVGVLCGLHAEARIADKLPHVLVGCSGARPERTRELTGYLIGKGVSRLISFGLAAGLNEHVEAGDLLLGATVVSLRGAWEADEKWNERFIECLPCYQCTPVWGGDKLLKTAKEKFGISVRSGCLIADMESHIVAEMAVQARIPFNVIRAVSDPLGMDLPPAARLPLLEEGRPDIGAIARSVYEKPSQIMDLIRLGRNTSCALASLRRAVQMIAAVDEG
ncbi:MAG: hypothetical protein AB7S81_03885 [Bdellovibrionales bacterium]